MCAAKHHQFGSLLGHVRRAVKPPNRTAIRLQWKLHRLAWNLSGGRLGRRTGGAPILELITTGHISGRERQILITYFEDDGAPTLVGTNAGKDVDPAWVRNLRANPEARARWDGQWHDVTAVPVTGAEHARVWAKAVEAIPTYADYGQLLTRPIPILRLEPRA
jgi:deazaflavin-dependent oxidoreductase (nitroreductase family)